MISPRERGIAAMAVLVALALASSTRSARADLAGSVAPRGTIPLRVQYVAPGTCPSSELFFGQIHERAPDVRLVPENERATLVKVDVVSERSASADPFRAQLVLEAQTEQAPAAERTERVVTGASCADVVRAVAFVVATFVVERASQPDAPSDVRVLSPAATAPSTPPDVDRALPNPRTRWYSALLASVGARTGIGPAMGGTAGIAFERFAERSWLAPSIRPSLNFGVMGRTLDPDLIIVRLFTAAVDGCAFGLGREDGAFGVSPCVRIEGGVAQGDIGASSALAPWFAPGLLARLRSRFDVGLVVELDAGAVVPLVSTRFHAYDAPSRINGARELVRTANVAIELSLSMGWTFW